MGKRKLQEVEGHAQGHAAVGAGQSQSPSYLLNDVCAPGKLGLGLAPLPFNSRRPGSFYLGVESGIPTVSNTLVFKMPSLVWELRREHVMGAHVVTRGCRKDQMCRGGSSVLSLGRRANLFSGS